MSVKEFDKLFGLPVTVEEEKAKFILRLESSVFKWLMSSRLSTLKTGIFGRICYELGVDYKKHLADNPMSASFTDVPDVISITQHDFVKTLRFLVATYSALKDPADQLALSIGIYEALGKCSCDIGVQWGGKSGVFYPTGEELLDQELINESLNVLKDHPNEQKDMGIAIRNYQAGALDGVVENCYLAVEGLARQLVGNSKTLLNNKHELLARVGFSKQWGNMLSGYIDYANEYRRHASEQRHDLKPSEVEAFLYLTCLFIRASVNTVKQNTPGSI